MYPFDSIFNLFIGIFFKKLIINEYEEIDFKSIQFKKNSKFNGIHHISMANKGFIFDRRLKYLY